VVPIEVRFRDIDAMGHVNNAVYLTYFESARVAYHETVRGRPTEDFRDFQFILAEVTCSYRSPAYLGETLLVGIRISSVRRKSFVFEYEMREKCTGRLVADGRSVQVAYDYRAGRTRVVSKDYLARVEALQGQPVNREEM
jgi:acyl-CoA thioester hydrolase